MANTGLGWRIGGAVALLLAAVGSAMAGETVRIGGNSSSMPLIQQLAELFRKSHPGIEVSILTPSIGSDGGLRALAAGQLDLVVSARPPKPEVRDKLAPPAPWLMTPIVLAGRDVKNVSFTRQQLADIYAGKLRQWPDGKPIRLIVRSDDVSDTQRLRALSPQLDAAMTQAFARSAQPVGSDAFETLKVLETTPNSLGSTTLGMMLATGSPIKPVAIDGVMPSVQAVRDGSYPLSKPLFLVTGKSPGAATRMLLDFLRTPAALNLARRFECAPLLVP